MSFANHFGAVADGRADDTAALQHAIDDGDGVLELAKGTYRITRPLVIDLTKRGYSGVDGGMGTARIVMDGPGPAISIIGDHRGTAQPSTVKPHTWQKERLPMIARLEIMGAHPEADGIRLLRTMQTTIQNVLIRQCRHGIHLIERNRNFLLADSHIYDCRDTGLFFDDCNLHQTIIAGNHISYCKRAGIRQLNGDVHNIQITGNDIEYNSDAEGTTGEIVLEAPEGVISEYTIASNTIQATRPARGANILILGAESDPPTGVRLVAISGNVIGSRTRNIVIRNGSRTSITGNTIYDGTELNISLTNCENMVLGSNTITTRPANWKSQSTDGLELVDCAACSVVGNIFNDCRLGDASGGGTISLRGCRDTAVSSCQIIDPLIRGIDLVDSVRCRISDNTISENHKPPRMLAAIRVAGKEGNNVVQNNTVSQGRQAAIDCPDHAGAAINNTVWK